MALAFQPRRAYVATNPTYQENIFKPLGMNDSGLGSFVTIIPRRASGYWPGSNGIENADRPDARMGFSAGSLYSTTEDLLRWEEGLFGGRVLSAVSLRKMTTPFKNDYACGLHINRVNGHLMIEHDGNNIGFNSDMAYYPEDRITVIVLANLNGTVTGEMTRALAAVAHGETPPIPSVHREISLPKEVLARYAGTYQFQHYTLKMVPEGNHLLVEFDNGSTLPVFPESETKFFFEEVARTGKLSSAQKYPAGEATDLLRTRIDSVCGAWPRTLRRANTSRAPLPTLPVMRPGLAATLGQNPALVASVASKIALEFKTNEEVVFIRGYIAYDRLVRAGRPTRDGR